LPFGLTPEISAALAIALLGAAYVRGYSGFGFSAIFIAFSALITNPLPLIPVVFACEMLMTLFQARGIWTHVVWRRVFTLLLGAAIVLPFSVAFILAAGVEVTRIVVSVIVLGMSLILLSGWTLKREIKSPGHVAVGMISGACNSAGVGGLPVAAFMTAQPMKAAAFRATMIVYLTGLDSITMPFLWHGGLVTLETAYAAILAIPFLGLGIWLGGRQFLTTSPENFRQFAVILLLVLALLGIARALI
jgi:uncharacterized membrane protein YfcA